MRKISLDSNAYTFYIKGYSIIEKELEKADNVYISTVVLGELFAAFKKGKKEKENLEFLKRFLSKLTVEILPVSRETAEVYGQIKNLLDKQGTPIPSNDMWIAAGAIETGSVLVTYDIHFLKVPGLRVWNKLN